MTYCWQCEVEHDPPVAEEDEACPDFVGAIDLLSRLAFEDEPIYDGRDGSIESTEEPYVDDWGGVSDTHPQPDPET